MRLTQDQANALSLLFPYQHFHEMNIRHAAGQTITRYEKQQALEAKVEPHIAMLRGEYSTEEINKLCAKWRIFFKLNFPDIFNEEIHFIESIQRQIRLS